MPPVRPPPAVLAGKRLIANAALLLIPVYPRPPPPPPSCVRLLAPLFWMVKVAPSAGAPAVPGPAWYWKLAVKFWLTGMGTLFQKLRVRPVLLVVIVSTSL